MMASTLNKRIYKERRKRPKRGEFILNEYRIKTVVKLYLFIENKELSFNIGLQFLLWHIEVFSIA